MLATGAHPNPNPDPNPNPNPNQVLTGPVSLPPVRLLCVSSNAELIDAKAKHLVFVRPAPQSASPSA